MAFTSNVDAVGDYLLDNQIITTQHPGYTAFEMDVQNELSRLMEDRLARDVNRRSLLLTMTLDGEQDMYFRSLFPEFFPVFVAMNQPVHRLWYALRQASNEWIAMATEKYATKVTHYGGSILHAMYRKARETHIELDPMSEVCAHERHAVAVDVHRMSADFAQMQSNTGLMLPRSEYIEYVNGQSYSMCDKPAACAHESQALCIDGSITDMSPVQVAAAMLQKGAHVAHGFFIYHPGMLVQVEGELPGTDVYYKKDKKKIQFLYPEGISGTREYDLTSWAMWLRSHTFSVGDESEWFQLELLNNRGPFMFYRMTRHKTKPPYTVFRHALDFTDTSEYVYVQSWKLKDGFFSDPTLATSYEPDNFLMLSRVERRSREFAMQLKPEGYDRPPIYDQLNSANNRWVTKGASVTPCETLSIARSSSMTLAVNARTFVDRYEASQLSKEMMEQLKRVTGFASMSTFERVSVMAAVYSSMAYQKTFGVVDRSIRWLCDKINDMCTNRMKPLRVKVAPAPTYVSLTSVANGIRAAMCEYYERYDSADGHGYSVDVNVSAPGASLYTVMRRFARASTMSAKKHARRLTETAAQLDAVPEEPGDSSPQADGVSPARDALLAVQKAARGERRKPVRPVAQRTQSASAVPAARAKYQATVEDAPDEDDVSRIQVTTDIATLFADSTPDAEGPNGFVDVVARTEFVQPPSIPSLVVPQAVIYAQHEQVVRDYATGDVADPVENLNQLYAEALPDVARARLETDTFSLAYDDQHRVLTAPYMRMSSMPGRGPVAKRYYRAKLKALNITKRQDTSSELLSSLIARNLNAPQIAEAQDTNAMVREVFDVFLRDACLPGVKDMLLHFQAHPAALMEDALKDWTSKADPKKVERAKAALQALSKPLSSMTINDYLVMNKADPKPTMSNKPINELVAGQTIWYHLTELNALCSAIIRVITNRIISVLRPNFMLCVLKDPKSVAEHIRKCHNFRSRKNKFLENDFSKYDKSQSQFVFELERYIFEQFGLNSEFLDQWMDGHVECHARSAQHALVLHVMYQRKSGDATTSIGNGILNLMSVVYAYQGMNIRWAVFMGDDSLVCADEVTCGDRAVRVLAEIFNLTAKFYVTDAPYFASNFLLIDKDDEAVHMLPDPIKRIERLSMHVSENEAELWRDKHQSFKDAMHGYNNALLYSRLAHVVTQRYAVSEGYVRGAAAAFGTLARDFDKFRSLWSPDLEVIQG